MVVRGLNGFGWHGSSCVTRGGADSFSLALPISIGGLGVREQTYLSLFAVVGVPGSTAVAMSLINYVLTNVVVGAIGGGLYALEGLRALARRNA